MVRSRPEPSSLRLTDFRHLLVIVAVVRCGAVTLAAQGSIPATTFTRTEAECDGCRWALSAPTSLVAAAANPDVWFGRIVGAAVDAQGRVYVGDVLQHQVIRIDPADGSVLRFGRSGRGPGEFVVPQLITPIGGEQIAVLDPVLARVSVFNANGSFDHSFQLPIHIPSPHAMVSDGHGHVYISGGASDGSAGVLHKVTLTGELVVSFGERVGARMEREAPDGGPLWWDGANQLLWFSRAGPEFELSAYAADGEQRVHLRSGEGPVSGWRAPVEVGVSGDGISIRGRRRLGTIALIPLADSLLLNVSATAGDSLQVDVFRIASARYVTTWQDAKGDLPGLGDGQTRIYFFRLTDEPDIVVRTVRLPWSN